MRKRSDEIAAICTPSGRSGIGIIRISGPASLTKVSQIIDSKVDLKSFQNSQTRRLVFVFLLNKNKIKIDEILLAFFPCKKSYTGETAIELHCHGGRAVLSEALKAVLSTGIRMAEPGEFTQRAVENGRINIIQAEAISELINSRTAKAIQASWRQYDGNITNKCKSLREVLLSLISEIYSLIDFDSFSANYKKEWEKIIDQCIVLIKEMNQAAERSKYILNGIKVVFIGPPNAGKSSIFNSIINIERSIVCDEPGTTRDHIQETIEIEGVEVKLVDTAGIRETDDKIEKMSIEKTIFQIENADIVVYVMDSSVMLDNSSLQKILNLNKKVFVLFNKCDLKTDPSVKVFAENGDKKGIFFVSAISKYGIEEFINCIAEEITNKTENYETSEIINIRQAGLLDKAKGFLERAKEQLKQDNKHDLLAHHIEQAVKALKEVIGEISNEEIMNEIFGKFCIGK